MTWRPVAHRRNEAALQSLEGSGEQKLLVAVVAQRHPAAGQVAPPSRVSEFRNEVPTPVLGQGLPDVANGPQRMRRLGLRGEAHRWGLR